MIANSFRRCESYKMYLKGDGSYQTVIIMRQMVMIISLFFFTFCITYGHLQKFSYTARVIFATFDT